MNVQLCLSTCHDRDFSTPVFKGKLNVTVETSPWTVLSGLSQINVITNVLGNLLHDDDPPSTVYGGYPEMAQKVIEGDVDT